MGWREAGRRRRTEAGGGGRIERRRGCAFGLAPFCQGWEYAHIVAAGLGGRGRGWRSVERDQLVEKQSSGAEARRLQLGAFGLKRLGKSARFGSLALLPIPSVAEATLFLLGLCVRAEARTLQFVPCAGTLQFVPRAGTLQFVRSVGSFRRLVGTGRTQAARQWTKAVTRWLTAKAAIQAMASI